VQQHLHAPGEIGRRFAEAGLRDVQAAPQTVPWIAAEPEVFVGHLIQGISFFQRELELLPWQARQELIDELVARGEDVRALLAGGAHHPQPGGVRQGHGATQTVN
jgi:hypothetical protein